MRRLLLVGTAVAALMGAPLAVPTAIAETTAPAAAQVDVESLLGATVTSADGEPIGEIDNVVIDANGEARHVIVGVGGFLGMGEKEVALAWEQISLSADGETAATTLTREQLEAMPDHEYPEGVAIGSVYDYDADVESNPYLREGERVIDDAAEAAESVGDEAEEAAEAAVAATTAVADAIAETGEEIAEDAGETIDEAERSVAETLDETPAEPSDSSTVTTTTTTTDSSGTTMSQSTTADSATGETVTTPVAVEISDADRLEASSLIGADVQTAAGESIGSIDEVVLGGDGRVEGVVIDVGGFLGMGSEPVLLGWDEITLQREGESLVATTALTADELEALGTYEKSSVQ